MWQKVKNIYHLCWAIAANVAFGFPSKKIKVIGVTGTDGKTTTSHMIYHILRNSGKKVSLTSTVYANVAGRISDTGLHVTTQHPWTIQKNLRLAADAGHEYFVLETTSHGIDQFRNWGIKYAVGVITNVTNEHLDYHKTYDNYLRTKSKLLTSSGLAVINRDDASFRKIKWILDKKNVAYVTYSLVNKADYIWKRTKISTNLKGDYNKQNMLAAYAACCELGIKSSSITSAVTSFVLPQGRYEIVYKDTFTVIVDFAHTPNSIMQILSTLKGTCKGRLIHVFGSAGLRDYKKRPAMGKASSDYADVSILTEEDYRTENIDDINESVIQGFKSNKFTDYVIIPDRFDAINHAVSIASTGDILILTGKGHEKSLARGKKEYDWDEFKAVKKALALNGYLNEEKNIEGN